MLHTIDFYKKYIVNTSLKKYNLAICRLLYCAVMAYTIRNEALHDKQLPQHRFSRRNEADMSTKGQLEIIRHTNMNHLEIFLIEMTAKQLHGHSDMELGIIWEGNMTVFVDQKRYELKKGDIYLINRYQMHSFSSPAGQNIILAFQVHTDFYRIISHQLEYLRFGENIFRSGPLYERLYTMLMQCARYYFSSEEFSEVKCSSLFLDALYLLLQDTPYIITSEKEYSSAQNNVMRINRITDYIIEHHQERIALDDVAALENITSYHASHFIKKMLGISFQDYLSNVRFDHALQLIHQTDLSILDICLESGFSSSHYLNQMFQKTFGCTTKEYIAKKAYPEHIEIAPPDTAVKTRYSYERSAVILEKIRSE